MGLKVFFKNLIDRKVDVDASKEDLQRVPPYKIIVNKLAMRRLVNSVTEFG